MEQAILKYLSQDNKCPKSIVKFMGAFKRYLMIDINLYSYSSISHRRYALYIQIDL